MASGGIGAPRGCRGSRGNWAVRGHWGCQGCKCSGVRRGIGGIRGYWGPQGCRGHWGPSGGVGVHWRWQVDWDPNHIGPSPGSQHFHWFPLGSDLPCQGQASDRNELCRLLDTFGTIFSGSLHICIYAT